MKLPPPNDPGWKGFGERHRRFMERHPNYDQWMEEKFRFFAECRAAVELAEQESTSYAAQPSLLERIAEAFVQITFGKLSIPLLEPAMAGDVPSFPDTQPLPPEWFPSSTVTLHFHYEGGRWEVERSGTMHELKLTFWSNKEEIIDKPIIVGGVPEPVPVKSPAYLSRIDIEIAKA